jgi:citrate lyase subunit beta/citryl-CoA lyase
VSRLAFGSIDFAADIDAAHDDEALLTARTALVLASRAAGKAAPVDGVTAVLDRPEAVAEDAARARRLGFGGKLCIHPAQIPAVTQAFRPSDAETAWARQITDAAADIQQARETAASDISATHDQACPPGRRCRRTRGIGRAGTLR